MEVQQQTQLSPAKVAKMKGLAFSDIQQIDLSFKNLNYSVKQPKNQGLPRPSCSNRIRKEDLEQYFRFCTTW
jgi:hypothetical protein